MSLFSVPVVALPTGGITNTPTSVPVLFEDEHVADATLSEGSYHFEMFYGTLQAGLHDGTLFLRAKFRDTPPDQTPPVRDYLAVEIIRNI